MSFSLFSANKHTQPGRATERKRGRDGRLVPFFHSFHFVFASLREYILFSHPSTPYDTLDAMDTPTRRATTSIETSSMQLLIDEAKEFIEQNEKTPGLKQATRLVWRLVVALLETAEGAKRQESNSKRAMETLAELFTDKFTSQPGAPGRGGAPGGAREDTATDPSAKTMVDIVGEEAIRLMRAASDVAPEESEAAESDSP